MMNVLRITLTLLPLLVIVTLVEGHGRLIWPPSRSSMWRFGFNSSRNYNDHQLFCGGYRIQWEQNGGKCGVCGDTYDGPRDNEAPDGKYARNGIIVDKYEIGQEIPVRVHILVNHKGWFEFRLCQNDILKKNVTHACFDKHLLQDTEGVTRFHIPAENPRYYNFTLQLPPGLSCRDCILQWKYNTGNNYGFDVDTKQGCIGCGRQEQFYGCADIAIGHDDVVVGTRSEFVYVPEGEVDERKEWQHPFSDRCTSFTCMSNSISEVKSDMKEVAVEVVNNKQQTQNRADELEKLFLEMKTVLVELVESNTNLISDLTGKIEKLRADLIISENRYKRLEKYTRQNHYGTDDRGDDTWDDRGRGRGRGRGMVRSGYVATKPLGKKRVFSKYQEGQTAGSKIIANRFNNFMPMHMPFINRDFK